jgi:hypothetical protein
MQKVASPVYGERNVILRYRICDLLWRPAGRLVRFVAVIHPTRGACLPDVHGPFTERPRDHSALWPAI